MAGNPPRTFRSRLIPGLGLRKSGTTPSARRFEHVEDSSHPNPVAIEPTCPTEGILAGARFEVNGRAVLAQEEDRLVSSHAACSPPDASSRRSRSPAGTRQRGDLRERFLLSQIHDRAQREHVSDAVEQRSSVAALGDEQRSEGFDVLAPVGQLRTGGATHHAGERGREHGPSRVAYDAPRVTRGKRAGVSCLRRLFCRCTALLPGTRLGAVGPVRVPPESRRRC